MALIKTKWVALIFAIFFAILQVLQPFIHAHLDVNHPIQEVGFHVGADHEESFSVSNTHSVSIVPHASHIISVESAIKQDVNPALFIDAFSLVFFTLCFIIVLQSITQRLPNLALIPHKYSRRRLPASRAPPQF